jgi:hypothetical protein
MITVVWKQKEMSLLPGRDKTVKYKRVLLYEAIKIPGNRGMKKKPEEL